MKCNKCLSRQSFKKIGDLITKNFSEIENLAETIGEGIENYGETNQIPSDPFYSNVVNNKNSSQFSLAI